MTKLQEAPLHVDLGTIETLLGHLQFTFVVSAEGDAHIQVYASDPSSAGKGGVMLMLDAQGYERLKEIVRGRRHRGRQDGQGREDQEDGAALLNEESYLTVYCQEKGLPHLVTD